MNISLRTPSTYFVLIVIVICLWGIYHAVHMGVADVLAYRAQYAIKSWEKEGRLPSEDEVNKAIVNASSAVSWEPGNPEYLNLYARLLTYKGLVHWGGGQFNSITEEAVALYQQSSQLRPNWPYTWANLALVKSYRSEFDDLFNESVSKAVTFGPWEPDVHTTLTEAGLFGWNKLSKEGRKLIAANIHRGLRFSRKEIATMVRRHQKRFAVCGYLPVDEYSKKFCGW